MDIIRIRKVKVNDYECEIGTVAGIYGFNTISEKIIDAISILKTVLSGGSPTNVNSHMEFTLEEGEIEVVYAFDLTFFPISERVSFTNETLSMKTCSMKLQPILWVNNEGEIGPIRKIGLLKKSEKWTKLRNLAHSEGRSSIFNPDCINLLKSEGYPFAEFIEKLYRWAEEELIVIDISNHDDVRPEASSSEVEKLIADLHLKERSGVVIRSVATLMKNPSLTLVIEDMDSGLPEFLFGELVKSVEKEDVGQLIFTANNLRPLEVLSKKAIIFAGCDGSFSKMKGLGKTNNLRDVCLKLMKNTRDWTALIRSCV